LPTFLAKVGIRRTPHYAILAILVIVGLAIPLGDIALVAQVANVAVLFSFAIVNVSASRALRGDATHSAWASLWRLQPMAGAVTCVALAMLTSPVAIAIGLGFSGLGFVVARSSHRESRS
jgi:hypothetical protein